MTHGQNRFYRELEEWMTSFTRVSVAATEAASPGDGIDRGALGGFMDQIAGQMQALTEFYATRDEIYEQDQLAADERALVMATSPGFILIRCLAKLSHGASTSRWN